MGGFLSGGGGSSSTKTQQDTNITNNTDVGVGVTFDLDKIGEAQLAQNDLDREMFKYNKGLSEIQMVEFEKNGKFLEEKRALDLQSLINDEKYKKYMLWFAGAGLGIAFLNIGSKK